MALVATGQQWQPDVGEVIKTVMAHLVGHLGILIAEGDPTVIHENCFATKSQASETSTLTEDIEGTCGQGSIHLRYDYVKPAFASSEPGGIRIFTASKERY